jgi:hypothetical protein
MLTSVVSLISVICSDLDPIVVRAVAFDFSWLQIGTTRHEKKASTVPVERVPRLDAIEAVTGVHRIDGGRAMAL